MKIIAFTLVLLCFGAIAQPPTPCSSPKASQFDFWVGEWNVSWNDTLRGTNKIVKMYGNCTIHENFSDPNSNFLGQSWSVYNANRDVWEQTWVDNQGAYIALSGGMVGDSMILATAERTVPEKMSPTGKVINRMIFFNIKKDSLDWSWEASTDGGKTWKVTWRIHYTRK
jgi:hypothetical protein